MVCCRSAPARPARMSCQQLPSTGNRNAWRPPLGRSNTEHASQPCNAHGSHWQQHSRGSEALVGFTVASLSCAIPLQGTMASPSRPPRSAGCSTAEGTHDNIKFFMCPWLGETGHTLGFWVRALHNQACQPTVHIAKVIGQQHSRGYWGFFTCQGVLHATSKHANQAYNDSMVFDCCAPDLAHQKPREWVSTFANREPEVPVNC